MFGLIKFQYFELNNILLLCVVCAQSVITLKLMPQGVLDVPHRIYELYRVVIVKLNGHVQFAYTDFYSVILNR